MKIRSRQAFFMGDPVVTRGKTPVDASTSHGFFLYGSTDGSSPNDGCMDVWFDLHRFVDLILFRDPPN